MPLRALPSISSLLADPRLAALPHALAVRAAREVVALARAALLEGRSLEEHAPAGLVEATCARANELARPQLRRVINTTGIPIHTNLGRAPLHPDAARAVAEVAAGYCNVEMDLEGGRRGGRLAGVEGLLRELTGAEAAIAVNNGAAALLLALTALTRDGEVIVSRGELVEIGGSFRVPEVVSAGGARLVEVGATNRTRVADFRAGISPRTAALLRVHPSNFRMLGFTERPDRAGLVALAAEHGLPVIEDLGSGLLRDLPGALAEADGADGEMLVSAVLAQGVDLVCFSGDKLLGGPQAGILAGRASLVDACRRHPLYRALRLDKLVLAALEGTLQVYAEGREAEIPVRAALSASVEELTRRAHRLADRIAGARVEQDEAFSGGGAYPGLALAGPVVFVPVSGPERLARALRLGEPAVVARVARDGLVLDPRTLLPGEEALLLQALAAVGLESRAAGLDTRADACAGPR